jgi:hypothetical protein
MWLQDVQSSSPLVFEGLKVTSCLAPTEAVKRGCLTHRQTTLRVEEFGVATSGGIWVAIGDKERGMRRKRLRRYIERLKALQTQNLTRDQLLMKLGAAKHDAGRAASVVKVTWPRDATSTASLEFSLDRGKLRQVRRREGRYLLRTNLMAHEPDALWRFYIQLTEVEQAFKELKHDLAIRPIFHKTEERIEAHIFVAFLAYCLQVTLKAKLRSLASGTTPREVIAKFKTLQMVDVHLPTTDGRELILSRYTQPEAEHRILLDQLRLSLPSQSPPKITLAQARQATAALTL